MAASSLGGVELSGIDLRSMNIQDAMMYVQAGVIAHQTDDVEAYMEKVQEANGKLTKLNNASELVNAMVNQFGTDTDVNKKLSDHDSDAGDRDTKLAAITAALKDAGVDATGFEPGSNPTLGQVKAALDTLTNDKQSTTNVSQLDMVKLQASMSQMSSSIATLTAFVKSQFDSIQGIVRNF